MRLCFSRAGKTSQPKVRLQSKLPRLWTRPLWTGLENSKVFRSMVTMLGSPPPSRPQRCAPGGLQPAMEALTCRPGPGDSSQDAAPWPACTPASGEPREDKCLLPSGRQKSYVHAPQPQRADRDFPGPGYPCPSLSQRGGNGFGGENRYQGSNMEAPKAQGGRIGLSSRVCRLATPLTLPTQVRVSCGVPLPGVSAPHASALAAE